MPNQQPLDLLRSNLLRRGLPGNYIRRVMGELKDHQQDLLDEQQTSRTGPDRTTPQERLGDLTELAERIVREYQATRFAGRHPVLAFLIAPIPLVLVTWILAFFGLALMSLGLEAAKASTKLNLGVAAIYYGMRFMPFSVVSLLLCRSANRSARGRWSLPACLLVALLAGSFVADLKLPSSAEQGHLLFGTLFLIPGLVATPLVAIGRQVSQLAVPLAIWFCFAVKFEYQRRHYESAAPSSPPG